jgi:hypothetical protein
MRRKNTKQYLVSSVCARMVMAVVEKQQEG